MDGRQTAPRLPHEWRLSRDPCPPLQRVRRANSKLRSLPRGLTVALPKGIGVRIVPRSSWSSSKCQLGYSLRSSCNAYGPTVGLIESLGCTALKDAPLGRAFSLEKREHARNTR